MIEDFITPLLYVSGLSIVWVTAALFMVRRSFDPATVFLMISAYCLIIPGVFYLFDLSSLPSTKQLSGFSSALLLQCLIIIVFFAGIISGFVCFRRPLILASAFPHVSNHQIRSIMFIGILFLSGASLIFAIYAILAGGGFAKGVDLVRHEGLLQEFSFIRQFVRIGSVLSIAYLFDGFLRKKNKLPVSDMAMFWASIMLVINLFAAVVTGGKSYLIYPVFTLILAYVLYFTKRPIMAMIPFVIALMVLLVGMQYFRVVYVAENNFDPEGQIMTGSGLGYLDTNLIYLDKMVDQTSMGEDFYLGLVGVIPRVLWEEKPEQISAGGKFRRTILPYSKAGWPVLGFNLWYGNFGWLGVVIGGFLTGLLLKTFEYRYSDYKENAYSFCFFILFILLILLPGGLDNQVFQHYILNVLPIWIFLALSHKFILPKEILVHSADK